MRKPSFVWHWSTQGLHGVWRGELHGGACQRVGVFGRRRTRKGYTGYEKDDESGLDSAQARYNNSTHGRFTSVDPLTASASIKNPQAFNRYTYILNSPYKFTDPLGLLAENTIACGNRCPSYWGGSTGLISEDDNNEGVFEKLGWNSQNTPNNPTPPPSDATLKPTSGISQKTPPTKPTVRSPQCSKKTLVKDGVSMINN